MLQVLLNEIRGVSFDGEGDHVVTSDEPNRVSNLADLKKSQIIAELVQATTYPERYVLALAESVPQATRLQPKDMLTLNEWLEDVKGVHLDRSLKHVLAHIVTRRYKEVFGQAPRTIARLSENTGNWSRKASGFEPGQLGILEASLNELMRLKGITEDDLGSVTGMRSGFRSVAKGRLLMDPLSPLGSEGDR